MNKKWSREVEDVAEAMRNASGGCVFLIGAGCSHSAGIPLASHFISEIERRFPSAFKRASDTKNYNSVMSQLTTSQRSDLLNQYIDQARINWAHLALAQLFHKQQIDRILTVNFDPLIMRACALVGDFPAIYDLATASNFNENRIAPRSVFYLNGQHTGFTTLNAREELEQHRTRLRQIVNNTGSRRIWVVVGYSGAADPLLDILAEPGVRFDSGLFWIGRSEMPSEMLRQSLLERKDKEAFYIGHQDADGFLTDLANRLGCFPPDLLERPFEHIEGIIQNIDFATGKMPAEALREKLLQKIARAKQHDAKYLSSAGFDWINALLKGHHQDVVNWYQQGAHINPTPEQRKAAAWAYIQLGNALNAEALGWVARGNEAAPGEPGTWLDHARAKWQMAGQHYHAAQEIEPAEVDALVEWAWALTMEAHTLAGSDLSGARMQWRLAGEKCQQALKIRPDMHSALNNWGLALAKEADALAHTDLGTARQHWQAAREKFGQALTLKPDMFEACNNLGVCLDSEADALAEFDEAAAHPYWQQAFVQYQRALAIKPTLHEALNNWGVALASQSDTLVDTDPEAARRNWALASEKYRQALAQNPALPGTLANLGRCLLKQYSHITPAPDMPGQLPEDILQQARELSERAEHLAPGYGAYNLACIFDLCNEPDNSLIWYEKSRMAGRLYTRQYIATGQEFDAIHDNPTFQGWFK
jgi:Tfp pilus assembly protein PilF